MKPKAPSNPSRVQPTKWVSADAFIALALAAVTLAVYAPAAGFNFINFDDPIYVTDNAHVRSGLTRANIAWAFNVGYAANWHPLTWLSHMLDAQFFGLQAGRHHLTNLLFHAANASLLFILLRRLTGALWRSAIVAALFSLHPLHVESAAWISERKDVLSTFFGLLTLWVYINGIKSGKLKIKNYVLALVFFALALMSKPMLVTLPLMMLLLDFWPLQRFAHQAPGVTRLRLVLEKLPFFALRTASCVITIIAQKRGSAITSLATISLGERIGNTFVSFAKYLGKTFWPENLAIYYPHLANPVWFVALAVIVTVAISAVVILFRRKLPFAAMGWFWFVITLVPVIGLVQVGRQAMADRYSYIPLIGIFIAVVWIMAKAVERWRLPKEAMATLTIVLLSACALQTRAQLAYWRDSERLFRHALAVTKENEVSLTNYGVALFESGRQEEGIGFYRTALRINPEYPNALSNLGMALVARGQHEEAIKCFKNALKVMPDPWSGHNNLGITFVRMGKVDDGIEQYHLALKAKPDLAITHHNLGMAFAIKGKFEDAAASFLEALKCDPGYAPSHKNLGTTYARMGRRDEAIAQLKEALRLNPSYADAANQLRALGVSVP